MWLIISRIFFLALLMKTRLKRIESKIAPEAASKTQNTSKTQSTQNSSKCLDMIWYFYENARAKMKMQGQKGKCKDDRKSYSLDLFEQVKQ